MPVTFPIDWSAGVPTEVVLGAAPGVISPTYRVATVISVTEWSFD